MAFLIFISAFLIRVTVQYSMGTFSMPETWEYEIAANNFISGLGLRFDIYGTAYYSLVTPLYPMLCVLVYLASGHSFFAMAIVQALISSFICVVIFWIGRHIFGNKVGLLAAILTIFHPGIIIYTSKFHPLVLDSLLLCLISWLLIKTRRNPDFFNQLKLGIAFGLGILTRSTIILFLPLSWLWLRKDSKIIFLTLILTVSMLLSPWLIRNCFIYKKPLMVTSSANVFWRGNNPLATGTSFAASGRPMLEEDNAMMSMIYGKSEIEQNRIFREESFKFIKDRPVKCAELFLKKFYFFWWFAPTTGIEYNKEWLMVYKMFYAIIAFFGLLGIIRLRDMSPMLRYDAFIIILLMLAIAVAQSLFYVETRHRWAVEPLMLIFTANGMIYAKERIYKCLKTRI